MSDKTDRAREFLDKASKWIGWCDIGYAEMIQYAKNARVEQVERQFVSVLLLIDGIHRSLTSAAKKYGALEWRDDLNTLRRDDPLLRYMWNARRSEAHDALIKWHPSMKHVEMQIVLPETAKIIQMGAPTEFAAAQRLFNKAFSVENRDQLIEKLKSGYCPTPAEQLSAGVRIMFSLDSLSLSSFKISERDREIEIPAPEQHFGKVLPPSATEAARLSIEFYRAKRDEMLAVETKGGMDAD